MKPYAKTATVAILAGLLATGAIAQSLSTGAGASVDLGANDAAAAMSAGTELNAAADTGNYGQVIAGLQASAETSADTAMDLEDVTEDMDIQTVLLSELRGNAGENAQALDQAIMSHEAYLEDIRAAIGDNPALSGALEDPYSAEDVVAVSTKADSSVTLVIDDRG